MGGEMEDHSSSVALPPARDAKSRRQAELLALLARVEAATGPDRHADCWLACALDGFFPVPKQWPVGFTGQMSWRVDFCCEQDGGLVSPGHGGDQMVRPYTASLDAALALVERCKPGGKVMVCNWPGGDRAWAARLTRDGDNSRAATAPLAILAALLKALGVDTAGPSAATDRTS